MAQKKDFDSLVADLKKEILDKIQSREAMNLIGETAKDLIYKRVKSGKGVESDTAEFPETNQLKPLSDKYKKQREKKQLGAFGSPKRSNLTASGEMLESITFKPQTGKVTLEIPNTIRKDGLANSEVAGFVREQRPFFNLSRGEGLVISQKITQIINGLVRLFNK